jgi:hypothetical protein
MISKLLKLTLKTIDMDTNSPVYDQLNKAWKSTCKILLGEEIGDLKDYEEWLKEYLPVLGKRKSHMSGKEATFCFDEYCKDAHFVSLDEVKEKSIEPLTINEIKDLDSIVEAMSEKWEYTGNKIFGRSTFVESSDIVFNSHYVSDSSHIENSQYIFDSVGVRDNSKYVFGSIGCVNCEFLIKVYGATDIKRCFEVHYSNNVSDLLFSVYCINCSDLLFSFNQRNKRNMIGNLQLPKDKYLSLKTKLIGEIRDELKKNKSFPSLFELVPNDKPSLDIKFQIKEEAGDIKPIEKAFSSTFKILFRKESTGGIDQYKNWLARHFKLPKEVVSPLGNKVYVYEATDFLKVHEAIPETRMIRDEEAILLADLHLKEKEIQNLDDIKKNLSKIAYFGVHYRAGKLGNIIKTAGVDDSSNICNTSFATHTEYAAVNGAVGTYAKYAFGSHRLTNSQFCIHCYYSLNLTRCFEVDSSTNCSDTYFAHNCEGLQDAMFCWNVKGKRHSIGNSELPPDQYRKIKDMLVEQMADEILKKKELRYDIFNIGCGRI